MRERAWQFLFLVTQSFDNTSNNTIYKTKLEFKSPSISAHFDIYITNAFLSLGITYFSTSLSEIITFNQNIN